MKTMADYISELLEKYNIDPDDRGWQKQVAKLIGISEPTMSAHLSGRANNWSDKSACRIADLLGKDRIELLHCAAMERAKDEDVRKAWESARRKLGSAAAGTMLAIALMGSPTPSKAANSIDFSAKSRTLYIMSNRRRKRLAA